MKHKLYPLWAILFSFTSCGWLDKDATPKGLPLITQEGKGTFGCYVNGKSFIIYSNQSPSNPNLELEYYPPPDNAEFHLFGTIKNASHEELESIELGAVKNMFLGSHILNDTSRVYIGARFNTFESGHIMIITKPTTYVMPRDTLSHVIGTLNLTRLTATNAAGTFEFKAWRTGFIDTVHVTEGRFDY